MKKQTLSIFYLQLYIFKIQIIFENPNKIANFFILKFNSNITIYKYNEIILMVTKVIFFILMYKINIVININYLYKQNL
jgi:hypothetical protein